MYAAVLFAHSLIRWIVLLLGVLVLGRAIRGRSSNAPWTPADQWTSLGFVVALDLLLLSGLALFAAGHVTTLSFHEPDLMWRSTLLRFFTLDHPILMLAATVIAHIGYRRTRIGEARTTAHRAASLWFGLALAIIVAAIPWPFLPYGRALLAWGH